MKRKLRQPEELESRQLLSSVAFEHDGIGYFVNRNDTAIARYDLQQEQWLPRLELRKAPDLPTAGYMDEDGLYVAYGPLLYRHDLDGSNGRLIHDADFASINEFFSDGNFLYAQGYYLHSFDKRTDDLVQSLDVSGNISLTPIKDRDRIFSVTDAAPAGVTMLVYEEETGSISNHLRGPSTYSGFGNRRDVWAFPNEEHVVDSLGNVFDAEDLWRLVQFAADADGQRRDIEDIVFFDSTVPITLADGKLRSYGPDYTIVGTMDVGKEVRHIFLNDRNIILISESPGESNGFAADAFPVTSIDLPNHDFDGSELSYELDDVMVANDGTLLVLSTAYESLFRWDPQRQRYVDRIALRGPARQAAYASQENMLYFGYVDGTVTRIDLSQRPYAEEEFAKVPAEVTGLVAANDILVVASDIPRLSHQVEIRSFDTDGQQLDGPQEQDFSLNYVWNTYDERVYFIDDSSSSDPIHSFEINAGGEIQRNVPIGEPRVPVRGYHPITVSPDGTRAMTGTGCVVRLNEQEQDCPFGKLFYGIGWLENKLVTLSRIDRETSLLETWDVNSYEPVKQIEIDTYRTTLTGMQRIHVVDENHFVAITQREPGTAFEFTLYDQELDVVTPSFPRAHIAARPVTLPEVSLSLNAMGSTEPDGDPLTYSWTQLSGPAEANLLATDEVVASLTATVLGEYKIQLAVSDGEFTDHATQRIVVRENKAPVAKVSLSENSLLAGRDSIQLDGRRSFDPDFDALEWEWRIVSGPREAVYQLNGANARQATFSADVAGDYVLQLAVSDGFEASLELINITVTPNTAPAIELAPVGSIKQGNLAIPFNASLSFDPDGEPVSFQWEITSQPIASQSRIENSTGSVMAFFPSSVGEYELTLLVSDGFAESTERMRFSVLPNSKPVIDFSGTDFQFFIERNLAHLVAANSNDPDDDVLSFDWRIVAGNNSDRTTIVSSDQSQAFFDSTAAGSFQVELAVSDGYYETSKQISIEAKWNKIPTAVLSIDRTFVQPGESILLDASASTDANEDELLQVKWSILSQPDGSHPRITKADAWLTDTVFDEAGDYVLRLDVSDPQASSSETIMVRVGANQRPDVVVTSAEHHITKGQLVRLDGSKTADADGDTLRYAWNIAVGPDQSESQVLRPGMPVTEFRPSEAGIYVVELVVADGFETAIGSVVLEVVDEYTEANRPPIARISTDSIEVRVDEPFVLDGSSSYDADGNDLTFVWDALNTSSVLFTDSTSATTHATISAAGTYAVQLKVDDGLGVR